MSDSKSKKSPCPSCRQVVEARIAGVWPFCSDRCKMKDLGSWMREEYSIAGQPATELDVLQHNANTSDDSE